MYLITIIYGLYDVHDAAAVKSSQTNSPKLPHRPKPDVNTLGNLSWRLAGGSGRDLSTLMELQLNKVFLSICLSFHFAAVVLNASFYCFQHFDSASS